MAKKVEQQRELVSMGEIARRYSVSVKTVRRHIALGVLKAYRVGPQVIRLDVAEVEQALVRPVGTADLRDEE